MRSALAAFALACAPATDIGCLEPTQIELSIYTDAACVDVRGTGVTVGEPGKLEPLPLAASTYECHPETDAMHLNGDIGSLVVVPSGAKDADVGIKVAMSLGGDVGACVNPPYDPSCIIARRSLNFIENVSLTLPIGMRANCMGQFCSELQTCLDGHCVDAEMVSALCAGEQGCELTEPGGGYPDCGPIVTGAPAIIAASAVARTKVAIAGDPASCQWGIAWSEGPGDVCFRTLGVDDPLTVHETVCQPGRGEVDDLAIESLGNGDFVVGSWSSSGGESRLWLASSEPLSLSYSAVVPAVSGDLAVRGDTVVMAQEYTDHVGYRVYKRNQQLFELEDTVPVIDGPIRPAVAFSGDDLVLSWQDGVALGTVLRFDFDAGSAADAMSNELNCIDELALGNREPSNVVGATCFDSGEAAELVTISATEFDAPGNAASYTYPATDLQVTGTASGWVVSLVNPNDGRITNFNTNAEYLLQDRLIAPGASSLAVAAMGDQLGVVWVDGQSGALWYRPIGWDLAGL